MKTLVRWSFCSIVMLAISGCLSENDNESSEAKYTPDVPSEFDKKEKNAWVVWIEAEEDGYEDMLILVGLDKKNKKISIRAVDFDEDLEKYVPLDDQSCIDLYNNVTRRGGVKKQEYTGFQTTKEFIRLDVNRDGALIGLLYVIRDKEGNKVRHKATHRIVEYSARYSNVYGSEGLLEQGEDCNHVSQSGEEGSAAP